MEYTVEILIDAPRDRVAELFRPEHYPEWMTGLTSYEVTGGTKGQTGATAKLVTAEGAKTYEMTELVESANFPDEYIVVYETDGIWNRNANRFVAESENQTRWLSENEFKFEGAKKALGLLPGSFKKQTRKDMEQFKTFVERTVGS